MLLKFNIVLFVLVHGMLSSYATTFNKLSVDSPIEINYKAEKETLLDFKLLIHDVNENLDPFMIRMTYVFNDDTLNSYQNIDKGYRGIVKTFSLEAGDKITGLLYLAGKSGEELKKVEGAFTYEEKEIEFVNTEKNEKKFTGNVWKRVDKCVFRIEHKEEAEQLLSFYFAFSESYEYDKLFLKFKINFPSQTVSRFEKEIVVSSNEFMEFKGKNIKLKIDGLKLAEQGTYFVEITHNHYENLLNGVKRIKYDLEYTN